MHHALADDAAGDWSRSQRRDRAGRRQCSTGGSPRPRSERPAPARHYPAGLLQSRLFVRTRRATVAQAESRTAANAPHAARGSTRGDAAGRIGTVRKGFADPMTTQDDFQSLVGTTLGPSDWRTLTETAVNRLEELTRGEARLKVDPDRARHHTLARQGGTIVPGFVTLAVGEAQLQHLLPAFAACVAASRIRFITPVMIGQPIR